MPWLRYRTIPLNRQNPNGVAAKELYGVLEPLVYAKPAVNAALFQLSKEGAIQQSGRRQPYKIASASGAVAEGSPNHSSRVEGPNEAA